MDKWTLQNEFEFMQTWLILHKYFYYVKNSKLITDQHFDSAEAYTIGLAKELDIKLTDLDPCNMVGFNEKSPYWEKCQIKYKSIIENPNTTQKRK